MCRPRRGGILRALWRNLRRSGLRCGRANARGCCASGRGRRGSGHGHRGRARGHDGMRRCPLGSLRTRETTPVIIVHVSPENGKHIVKSILYKNCSKLIINFKYHTHDLFVLKGDIIKRGEKLVYKACYSYLYEDQNQNRSSKQELFVILRFNVFFSRPSRTVMLDRLIVPII